MRTFANLFNGRKKTPATNPLFEPAGGSEAEATLEGKGKTRGKLKPGAVVETVKHGRGVVLAKLLWDRGMGIPVRYHVRLATGRTTLEQRHALAEVTVEVSAFPLNDLPLHVLALVLFWLPMRLAAEAACVSRRFATAFGDNVAWKRRCLRDVTRNIDIEATFEAEKHQSWLLFYRRYTPYRIRVVIVRPRGRYFAIGEIFDFVASPTMSVADFIDMVGSNARARYYRGRPMLPHNPVVLQPNYEELKEAGAVPDKSNCKFSTSNPSATIAEAGLCDGAVLEQPELERYRIL